MTEKRDRYNYYSSISANIRKRTVEHKITNDFRIQQHEYWRICGGKYKLSKW